MDILKEAIVIKYRDGNGKEHTEKEDKLISFDGLRIQVKSNNTGEVNAYFIERD